MRAQLAMAEGLQRREKRVTPAAGSMLVSLALPQALDLWHLCHRWHVATVGACHLA